METSKNRELVPFMASHPTYGIKEEIKARGMSHKELAERMGMQASNLSRFLKGGDITPSIAAKLENALDIPADFWLSLQAQYERDVKAIALREEREKSAYTLERMLSTILNLPELYKRLKISTVDFIQKKLELLEGFLGFKPVEIASATFFRQAMYKKSDKLDVNEQNHNTWITLAYISSLENTVNEDFVQGNAMAAAKEIANKTHMGGITETDIKSILNRYGIGYSVVQKLDKVPIDAVSMKVNDKPSIVTTHRYDDMSKLIFNIMHELGHIEKHMFDSDMDIFVYSDGTYSPNNPMEREANMFAEDLLIDRELFKEMMDSKPDGISHQNIVNTLKAFSRKNNLDFNIVMWRYRHERKMYAIKGVSREKIRK